MRSVDRSDSTYMEIAVDHAQAAQMDGDRPFGCVVADDLGTIVGVGKGSEREWDPTRHSEIAAIQEACLHRGGLLQGCTLYSTHEPCVMCIGAINHAKLSRVVFGSWRCDLPQLFRTRGTFTSAVALLSDTSHPPEIVSGVLRKECIKLFDEEVKEALRA
jgi:tRNA(adenine34) deaminase